MIHLIVYTLLVIYITMSLVSRLWWEILERKKLARRYTNSNGKKDIRLLCLNEIIERKRCEGYDYHLGDTEHELRGNWWLDED